MAGEIQISCTDKYEQPIIDQYSVSTEYGKCKLFQFQFTNNGIRDIVADLLNFTSCYLTYSTLGITDFATELPFFYNSIMIYINLLLYSQTTQKIDFMYCPVISKVQINSQDTYLDFGFNVYNPTDSTIPKVNTNILVTQDVTGSIGKKFTVVTDLADNTLIEVIPDEDVIMNLGINEYLLVYFEIEQIDGNIVIFNEGEYPWPDLVASGNAELTGTNPNYYSSNHQNLGDGNILLRNRDSNNENNTFFCLCFKTINSIKLRCYKQDISNDGSLVNAKLNFIYASEDINPNTGDYDILIEEVDIHANTHDNNFDVTQYEEQHLMTLPWGYLIYKMTKSWIPITPSIEYGKSIPFSIYVHTDSFFDNTTGGSYIWYLDVPDYITYDILVGIVSVAYYPIIYSPFNSDDFIWTPEFGNNTIHTDIFNFTNLELLFHQEKNIYFMFSPIITQKMTTYEGGWDFDIDITFSKHPYDSVSQGNINVNHYGYQVIPEITGSIGKNFTVKTNTDENTLVEVIPDPIMISTLTEEEYLFVYFEVYQSGSGGIVVLLENEEPDSSVVLNPIMEQTRAEYFNNSHYTFDNGNMCLRYREIDDKDSKYYLYFKSTESIKLRCYNRLATDGAKPDFVSAQLNFIYADTELNPNTGTYNTQYEYVDVVAVYMDRTNIPPVEILNGNISIINYSFPQYESKVDIYIAFTYDGTDIFYFTSTGIEEDPIPYFENCDIAQEGKIYLEAFDFLFDENEDEIIFCTLVLPINLEVLDKYDCVVFDFFK